MDEKKVASMVREDKVDILVELTGHTANNKLGMMACRPAPLQVTWIGYPNTTGLPTIDYRITDNLADPPDTKQKHVEDLVRLPECFLFYTPSSEAGPASPAPAFSNGFVTFGSFNNLAKITPKVLQVWAKILCAVPNSRLIVKCKPFCCDSVRQKFLSTLEQLGLESHRVDLVPLILLNHDHMQAYSLMDISLDTFPYAGTTTTCESLYMGVPCVTMGGSVHAHNVGVSLLTAVDHGVLWALTPNSAPDHYNGHSPSKHHATKWIKRGFRPFSSISYHRYHHERPKPELFAPAPSYQVQPPTYIPQGPAPTPYDPSSRFGPAISPSSSSLSKNSATPPNQAFVLPPPPPNEDCATVTCTQPLTYTPAGSPCACVWPIEVKLRLLISPYTFFPLVSELAKEIATSVSLNVTQARIMGANADGDQLDETIVLVNLVPLKQNFNISTAFSIYQKFWRKQVNINSSRFGAYEVLHVQYPGLPPSPPMIPSNSDVTIDQSDSLNGTKGLPSKPFGADISGNRREDKSKPNGSIIAVVIISSVTAVVVLIGVFWLLLLKCGCCFDSRSERNRTSFVGKPSGTGESLIVGSRKGSESMSFSSSLAVYTGTAKIYSLSEIERATANFDSCMILGEGGFGVVYSGILEDGRKAAVKVLKRDDRQGSREFLAEVEMLSRLHHRNLVKLFGICTEDHFRCLVYELVPNGSVESHLHGPDKITPLDWCARMKIALGAARGLAYLHEDSNPRVIHRDFKSSNILLENDFTPKVSDFGLARTALDDHKHISTHVMGTFGYLAPEYAMTGHLLVKSDVYSYGVVLLELLTGRKPVDLLQPPGQENLVTWARPLLTNKEALETIIDPNITNSNIPFDSILKVAAIASMCVQPEVSHRPFMGEVVQALKLVCNEFDEIRELTPSRSCSRDEDLDFGMVDHDSKIGLSDTDLRSRIENVGVLESESFRREFNSAPLKMGRKKQFWQRLRGLSRGSTSEHEHDHRFSSNL